MPPKQHPDYKYIQALLENNREGINTVYQHFLKQCINHVQKHNGTVDDAFDIFQESLMAIILFVRKRPEFVLSAPFGGFLRPFYIRLWIRELGRRKKESVIKTELKTYKDSNQDYFDPSILEEVSQEQKRLHKLHQQLKKLSEICQKILQLSFWKNLKPREIAPMLGISSNFVSVRKKRCLKHLKKMM